MINQTMQTVGKSVLLGAGIAMVGFGAMMVMDKTLTIGALVARLDQAGDPLWLTGDVVGALTALTGRRFGYDRAAWQAWWHAEQANWPR